MSKGKELFDNFDRSNDRFYKSSDGLKELCESVIEAKKELLDYIEKLESYFNYGSKKDKEMLTLESQYYKDDKLTKG